MRSVLRALVDTAWACGLLLGAATAQAATVEWRFDGVFTHVDPSIQGLPPSVTVGADWTVWLRFDTKPTLNSKVLDSDGNGARYRFDASSVSMRIAAGSFGPATWGNERPTDQINVRDNFLFDPDLGGPLTPYNVDGISFSSTDLGGPGDSEADNLSLILRSEDLGLLGMDFNNPELPRLPPAGLADGLTSVLQICLQRPDIANNDPCGQMIQGDVTSIRALPLPGSALLAGLGLLLLPLSRRRPARVPGSCA